MKIEEAQHLSYELLDSWSAYHDVTRELSTRVTEAFSVVAKGSGANPSLGILSKLEAMEAS